MDDVQSKRSYTPTDYYEPDVYLRCFEIGLRITYPADSTSSQTSRVLFAGFEACRRHPFYLTILSCTPPELTRAHVARTLL
jgi:hypothetical protein